MKPSTILLTAALALAAPGLTRAEPARSLNQVRSEINSGTWAGTPIFKARPLAESPAPAGSAAVASPAAASAPAAERNSLLPRFGEPLSRQPMNAAKRLDSDSIGVPLPTAPTR